MTAQWYALHSKPMKEDLLAEQLSLRSIEHYYPRLRLRPVNPRARKVRPYFPGYLFAHLTVSESSRPLPQWIPGMKGIVCMGEDAISVPDHIVAEIRQRLDEINAAGGEAASRGWQRGQPLTIQEGPFRGFEAIFDCHISGEDRVRVLLTLLGRPEMRLDLPRSFVQARNAPRRPG